MDKTVDLVALEGAIRRYLAQRDVEPDEIRFRLDMGDEGFELHCVVGAFGTNSYTVASFLDEDAADLDAVAITLTATMEWQGQPRAPFAMDEMLLGDDGEPVAWAPAS